MSAIWNVMLDKRYRCQVIRVDEGNGTLGIYDTVVEEVLLETAVSLSYGAIFGPDMDDVSKWQDICVSVIDKKDES